MEAVVADEHQRQGAATVTVRNIITSMRSISDADWTLLFERMSEVDIALAEDPGFSAMDFATRNLYRSAVEALARHSPHSEIEVARLAVAAAKRDRPTTTGVEADRQRDTGYHLLAGGRRAFESEIRFRPSLRNWVRRCGRGFGVGGYVVPIIIVAAALMAPPLMVLSASGVALPVLLLLGLLGFIPAIDAAVAVVNRGITQDFGATLLPALALRDGIPTELRTLIAVPTC